jgi:hypothetical protein
MIPAAQERALRKRYKEMAPVLDEQSRRRFAVLKAQALGRGGVSLIAKITGLARRLGCRRVGRSAKKNREGLDCADVVFCVFSAK